MPNESAQKVDPGEREKERKKEKRKKKSSNRSCRDSNPRPFDHESSALTTELYPLPEQVDMNMFPKRWRIIVQELCESRGGRPELPS